MKYIDKFLNPNKDEKEHRIAEYKVCRIGHEIDGIEKDIKRIRKQISKIESSINEQI